MGLNQLFRVATEFKFEIGSALIGTRALTDQVDALSNAADNVSYSLARMGTGFIINMGTGGAGLLGLLRTAIESSDKFTQSQISMSNIIAANRDRLIGPIDTFNERMMVSESLMMRIADLAKEFTLEEGPFLETTKMLMAQLTAKGLAGTNFENAINLSRHFMKAAPSLGVSTQDSMGQLLRAIEGGASQGDTLFRRLTGETQSMREFVGQTQKFNQLKPDKRLKLITAAMQEFTSSADEIIARTRTIHAQFIGLKNVISGLNGIVKPLGTVLIPMLVDIMANIRNVLDKEGRAIFLELAQAIYPMTKNLKGTIATILQLRDASADLKRTEKAFGFGAAMLGIGWILSKITRIALLANPAIGAVAIGLTVLYTAFQRMDIPIASIAGVFLSLIPVFSVLGLAGVKLLSKFKFFGDLFSKIPYLMAASGHSVSILSFAFRALGFVLGRLLFPLAIIMSIFQLISRAVAIAKIKDALALPELIAKFVEFAGRLRVAIGKILRPFAMLFNAIAEAISPLFQRTFILHRIIPLIDAFVTAIEFIGTTIEDATAATFGWIGMWDEFVKNIANASFMRPGGMSLSESIEKGWQKGLRNVYGADDTGPFGKKGTVQQVTNINGGIKIENKFKEQMEPDRIAFSLTEQLKKISQAPTRAKGQTFSKASLAPIGGV